MRNVGLDLGVRHIAYCEVKDGKVIDRCTVRKFTQLASRIGPESAPAQVAFEACREGWHVHDELKRWGHTPLMLDTTRVRSIGVGQHKRKNDAIDAETIAIALESGRVPLAHVLSPERRALRAQLSVRGALVETRAHYVTTIRGLARASGVVLPTGRTQTFTSKLEAASLDESTRVLIAPLVAVLKALEIELTRVEATLASLAERDPIIGLCATVPGVGLIVAATFVSVVDEGQALPQRACCWRILGSGSGGGDDRRPWQASARQHHQAGQHDGA
jgi:transposase